MENNANRLVYLDNIRNFLVYNVVFHHASLFFVYPFMFWWAVVDREGASRIYETCAVSMYVYMMPCLLFIAALFIFPSLKKTSPREYLGKRFLRLCVPVIVFMFCAGDVYFQLLLQRLNSAAPVYRETFLDFWRAFAHLPWIYLSGAERKLNAVMFNYQHVWFLTLLFFLTVIVVVLSRLGRSKSADEIKVAGRRTIIKKTILFAVLLSIVYAAVLVYYVTRGVSFSQWVIAGKTLQFLTGQIWVLVPLFLFGLYVWKQEWLTRGDIGSWKMWGVLAFVPFAAYVLLHHFIILPDIETVYKVVEHNFLSGETAALPVVKDSVKLTALGTWFLLPMACVFLLMFFLSFARKFFNRPSAATAFCSRHSINVYVLHYVAVLVLQDLLMHVPVWPIVKILLMTVIIIPACLWLSYRLVYPYPKIAIAFFVALKLIALAVGFTFFYYAILTLVFVSFAGAVYEYSRFLVSRKASPEVAWD